MPKPRVVIAEDHDSTALGHRTALGDEFEIFGPIANGLDVPPCVEHIQPDLLLLDLSLKGCNGLALMPEIRRLSPRTRVIVVTMYDDYYVMQEAFRLGAMGFVTKDTSARDLPLAVREVRAGRTFQSPEVTKQRGREAHPVPGLAVAHLTEHRRKILELIGDGLTTDEIAERLFLMPSTIFYHRREIRKALGLSQDSDLARAAMIWRAAQEDAGRREKEVREFQSPPEAGAADPPLPRRRRTPPPG